MQFSYGLSDVALAHHRHTTQNDVNGLWGFFAFTTECMRAH